MLTPIVIGLPGAGKSTVLGVLADRLDRPIFDSDATFRVFRALPAKAEDPRAEVMRRFLARVGIEFPDLAADLCRDASEVGTDGKCALADGRRFRQFYTENIFRVFEVEMLRWVQEQGLLAGRLPDLSASATLHPENRALFSHENGYFPVLLAPDPAVIRDRLLQDYATHVASGRTLVLRGGVESELDAAIRDLAEPEEEPVRLRDAAEAWIAKAADRRMPAYHDFARAVITPAAEDTPEDVAQMVLDAITRAG